MSLPISLPNTEDIRDTFAALYENEEYLLDKNGGKVVEILGAHFLADEPTIFGKPNQEYIEREIQWYESQKTNVNYFPGGPPKIWREVSSVDGDINSNYGYLVYSDENYKQFLNCQHELEKNPFSRRAIMIYTRPSMWYEYYQNGMSDFICTNTVQYFIRDGQLHSYVQMRSCDAWAGYRNDFAWQDHVLNTLLRSLNCSCLPNLQKGSIIWNCGSLHIYDRQFYLIENYGEIGEYDITKEEYDSRIEQRRKVA